MYYYIPYQCCVWIRNDLFLIQLWVLSSGTGSRQKFRIHADPDPQHWSIQYYSVICRPSDHTVGWLPGPRFEPGRYRAGGLEAETLTLNFVISFMSVPVPFLQKQKSSKTWRIFSCHPIFKHTKGWGGRSVQRSGRERMGLAWNGSARTCWFSLSLCRLYSI